MDYLARISSPIESEIWESIDKAVVDTAKRSLIARRFLSIYGPLGAGAISVHCDTSDKNETSEDGIVKTSGRTFYELPQIYEDFIIFWRDIENNVRSGVPIDYSSVAGASQSLSKKEDKLIFYGNEFIKSSGLINTKGVQKIKVSDWQNGENPFIDIVKAVNLMQDKGIYGKYVLCTSQSLYVDLQRIQQGTGMTELERISKMLLGVYNVPFMKTGSAVLLCPEPQYMDLAIGQDMATSYLEQKELNHSFRLLETVLPRIKNPNAIVVFE